MGPSLLSGPVCVALLQQKPIPTAEEVIDMHFLLLESENSQIVNCNDNDDGNRK